MDKKFKLLIVDDELINIRIMASALKDEYDILSAPDGFRAISQIKENKPDLVLLDVMMPDFNGFEVCSSIKSDATFADIPVIFLTSMDDPHGELQGLEAGAIDYLPKPVNIDMLKARVHNHLELKRRNDLVKEQRDLLARKNKELESAFARIRRLEGIIPICMHCKSIRCDDDSWQQIVSYLSDHTDALFTHGICPICMKEHYSDIL